jgi:hypothetical protein
MQEPSVHSVKETGWCGVTSSVIIHPQILGEEQLNTATVNAKSYQDTLENFTAADRRRLCTRNIRYNKDTTSHISTVSADILRNIFPGQFISPFGGTFWPPRTPDLTDTNTLKVCDFLKRTASFEKLKTRIREEISLIHRNI